LATLGGPTRCILSCASTSGKIFCFIFWLLCNVSYSDKCQTRKSFSVCHKILLLFHTVVINKIELWWKLCKWPQVGWINKCGGVKWGLGLAPRKNFRSTLYKTLANTPFQLCSASVLPVTLPILIKYGISRVED